MDSRHSVVGIPSFQTALHIIGPTVYSSSTSDSPAAFIILMVISSRCLLLSRSFLIPVIPQRTMVTYGDRIPSGP